MSKTNSENNIARMKRKKKQKIKRRIQLVLLFLILILTALGIWGAIRLVSDYNDKNTFEYQYAEAVRYFESGSYDKALTHLNKALGMDDIDAADKKEAVEKKYFILLGKKDYEEAIKVMLGMIEEEPTKERYYDLMELYSLTGKYDQMDKLANKLAGTEFNDVYAEYMIGNISISLAGGTYEDKLKIEMAASKADLIIHYTLDGSVPTIASDIYAEPFVFEEEGSYTIRAIGINSNGMTCEEICETYVITFPRPEKPLVTPATGVYDEEITIDVVGVLEGITVYYTLDGTRPDDKSQVYTEPIVLPPGNYIFNAIAVNAGGIESELVWRVYEYMPEGSYSYGAALIKVKNNLISKGVMLDMDGNTTEGTVIKVNFLDVTSIDDTGRKYYIFQATSEYNGMSETLSGYYAVSVDDGAYLEPENVELSRDKQEQENVSDNQG